MNSNRKVSCEEEKDEAIADAMAVLAVSSEFTLVYLRPGEICPEVTGFSGAGNLLLAKGLEMAASFLNLEAQADNEFSDVQQLSNLLCSN